MFLCAVWVVCVGVCNRVFFEFLEILKSRYRVKFFDALASLLEVN